MKEVQDVCLRTTTRIDEVAGECGGRFDGLQGINGQAEGRLNELEGKMKCILFGATFA